MTSAFSLQWENISVAVVEKKYWFLNTTEKKKLILDNVYNVLHFPIVTYSGCGKTTLLGAISGRLKGKEGVVKINNKVVGIEEMNRISGYIQQEDMFTESLTVYEHMKFVAALRLNKTREERNAKILKLLTELNLEGNRHTILRLLSGGERRRLTLATELINDPFILMCDEPTTGLDSFSAMSVVQKLEATAMTGKLVMVTLHQPSSQLFHLFNNIILLANGKLIFEGSKRLACLFFERAHLYCPVSFNPADFYIKCVTVNPDEEEKGEREINRLSKLFNASFRKTHNVNHLFYFNDRCKENASKKKFFTQLKWLTWRVFIDSSRNIHRLWTSYAVLMITALILSISFSNVRLEESSSVQNIQGVLLLMISELIFAHMYYVIYIFPEELNIIAREKALYSPLPYILSKVFSLIPMCFINAISFLIIYFVVLDFLQGPQLFLSIFIILLVTSLCGICFGLCMSSLFPTVEYIDLFIVPCEMIVMLVSGLWIKIDTLPKVLAFVKYCSPFYFGFQSISILYWEKVDNLANCTRDDLLPCYENGKEVLKQYGFFSEYDVVALNIMYLFILILVYTCIGYMGIVRKRALNNLY